MKTPHPIPYQGSKRNLANTIMDYFPSSFDRFVEPFAGSAAMSIAVAMRFPSVNIHLNDINEPLIELWREIVNRPLEIATSYEQNWNEQKESKEDHYYAVRKRFNESRSPQDLLFLLAKCVKAAVRYNSAGEFNQSPDKRRLGRSPSSMKGDIVRTSNLLKGRCTFSSKDYQSVLKSCSASDLVYMDPPYQGTGMNGGFNYAGNIGFAEFVGDLFELNSRSIPYILSYDGRTGEKVHGKPLPESLNLRKFEIIAGRSTQATLLSRQEITIESVYLSPSLIDERESKRGVSKTLQLFPT